MSNLTQGLTLETLPNAFTHLAMEVSEIKRLLLEKSNEQPTTDPDELLTVRGAAEVLKKPKKARQQATNKHRTCRTNTKQGKDAPVKTQFQKVESMPVRLVKLFAKWVLSPFVNELFTQLFKLFITPHLVEHLSAIKSAILPFL